MFFDVLSALGEENLLRERHTVNVERKIELHYCMDKTWKEGKGQTKASIARCECTHTDMKKKKLHTKLFLFCPLHVHAMTSIHLR